MSSSKTSQLNSSCSICSNYVGQKKLKFYGRDAAASEVVHQKCLECNEIQFNGSQLCSFCSHIRPSHLLTCACVHSLFDDNGNGQYVIQLGTQAELQLRQEACKFCRWCLQVAQADSQLRQYTIDEQAPIYIMRRICIEKLAFDSEGDDVNVDCQPEVILYITSKTSRFVQNSVNPQWVKLGHNKRSPWVLTMAGSSISTDKNRTRLETFSVVSPSFQWAVARRWMTVCENEHENCRKSKAKKLPTNFRLVDIELKCLVDAHVEPYLPFIALSYVWGADPSSEITARRDNLHYLKQPGSLCRLPRTILHAMEACKRLDQRYLWVDRLCIVQDDKEDKYGQIRSLEAIYTRAKLVIVAACGDSIHSGLIGVNDDFPRNRYQISTDVFGFTMANQLHGFEIATQSVWNERAWTYQEAILARRKLYFTPAEIWFECAEGVQRENAFSVNRKSKNPQGNRLRLYNNRNRAGSTHDDYEDYRRHLERYSRRGLTYPSDVYNAFHGIEDAFYSEGGTIFGLPERDFSRALLWYPYDWSDHLQMRRPSDKDIILPSWSWASLIGHIATCGLYGQPNNRALQRGSFYCSLCEWFTCNRDNGQQSIRRINAVNDNKVWSQLDEIWAEQDHTDKSQPDFDSFRDTPDYRQFLALAWAKGCIELEAPTDLLVSLSESALSAENLASRWPTVGAFWAEVRRGTHHTQTPYGMPNLHSGYLLTRTQYSVLRVEHNGSTEHFRGNVYVPNVHFVINLPQNVSETVGSLLGTVEYRLRDTATPDRAEDVNFIALAVGSMPVYVSSIVDEIALRKNCFHTDRPERLLQFAQPGVVVMAVTWDGPIARRLALGWVTLQGWVDSKPKFKTVILA
ncbi:heterokaryon incompatibility protein-domain-containing protein [Xylaria cubensis]|nr:heterokaryon incompatibility protein-domain-containing protein [Xylaria cubensis]